MKPRTGQVIRDVVEDLDKAVTHEQLQINDVNEQSYFHRPETYDPDDPDLKLMKKVLDSLNNDFGIMQGNKKRKDGKTKEEITSIFVSVSCNHKKARQILEKKDCVTWTELEDLALAKPEESPEFQILLSEKGWKEIAKRRSFLGATPKLAS